jgi:glycerol-3-phosphate acyltransferase PlsY
MLAAAAVAALVGHIFPVWLGFRGGKGVATGAGVFLALAPMAVVVAGAIFVIFVWWRRMVSLASIAAAVTIPTYLYVQSAFVQPGRYSTPLLAASVTCAWLIVYAHRGNISRIFNGTESRISDLKR